MTRDNWRGASTAVAKARECGVDNVRISAVFQNDGAGYFDDFGDQASKMCKDLARQSVPGFQVINLFDDRLKDLRQERPDYHACGFSRFCTYIGADQKVYRCCVYAYNDLGMLGDLRGQSFRRLWFSDDVQQDLREFDAMQCERCMFNEKNRAIQDAIEDGIVPEGSPPDHVNFI
jgi:MoaA/NifB/PqqE/SkfB family radical SAM enzyme